MAKVETTIGGVTLTNEYDYGQDLDQAIQMFGKEVVFSQYRKGAVLSVQAKVRGLFKAEGATQETVRAGLNQWKLGVATERAVDWSKRLGKMSTNQAKALLAAIKAKLQETK